MNKKEFSYKNPIIVEVCKTLRVHNVLISQLVCKDNCILYTERRTLSSSMITIR